MHGGHAPRHRQAREFAHNAEVTNGKSMVIVGASINHWYNNNLSYRAPITALILCGCCGVNGGGMNHYVGQEKLTLAAPWTSLALGVGMLLPVIGKDDLRRRVMINSIATVWDGNEVWLLVAGGAGLAHVV